MEDNLLGQGKVREGEEGGRGNCLDGFCSEIIESIKSNSNERSVSSPLYILSCYAPTFTAMEEVKEKFYDDFQ